MANNSESLWNEDYTSRINIVQDYIESNLLREFSLNELAKVANFSPYHFHRIFHAMTGETLFQYIQRIRLEKAAFLLLSNRKMSITDIALQYGFSNQASFAKAFKNRFNMSASKLRNMVESSEKEDFITKSNMGKVLDEVVCYNSCVGSGQGLNWNDSGQIDYSVEIKNMSPMKVIYIRHTGPYKKDSALFQKLFGRLFHWAEEKRLIHETNTKWLTLCHDTPDITPDGKLRVSVCMTVDRDVDTLGEVGMMTIPGGKYAIGHFEIFEDQYQCAWNEMFSKWLPRSRYQPDDRLSFELYQNNSSGKSGKHIVDIYIPIRPL